MAAQDLETNTSENLFNHTFSPPSSKWNLSKGFAPPLFMTGLWCVCGKKLIVCYKSDHDTILTFSLITTQTP